MKNKFLNRTKYLGHALLMAILFFGSIQVNAQTLLANWSGLSQSVQTTYPKSAAYVMPSNGVTATENYSGLLLDSDIRYVFRTTNGSSTLDTATAPYLEYTLNFSTAKKVDFDRFVLYSYFNPGRAQLRWSVDNFGSSLGEFYYNATNISPTSYYLTSRDLNSLSTFIGTSVTFRIYFYKADNFVATGNLTWNGVLVGRSIFLNGGYYVESSFDGTPSSYFKQWANVGVYVNSVEDPLANVNIVSSGGAAEGTGWTYSNGVVAPNSLYDVSINASDIVSKLSSSNVTIQTNGSITISSSMTSNTNKSLTVKASRNILQPTNVNVATNGGDVIYWSDSDNDGQGAICIGNATGTSSIVTNGGDITLGGGSDITTGYASSYSGFLPWAAKPYGGVSLFNTTLNAKNNINFNYGGNIVVRGAVNSQIGNVSGRGVNISGCTIQTTGQPESVGKSGNITIDGTAANFAGSNPWGIAIDGAGTIENYRGDINITGKGGINAANARGVAISGNTNYVKTVNGRIFITDTTPGTSANFTGMYLNQPQIQGNLDLVFRSDKFQFDGGAVPANFTRIDSGSGGIVFEPYTNSFTSNPQTFDKIIFGDQSGGIVFGKSTNTANITFGGNTSSNTFLVDGNTQVEIFGGNIHFNRPFYDTFRLYINAKGTVTQSNPLTVTELHLNSTVNGAVTLTNVNNSVDYLSAGTPDVPSGNVSFYNNKGLTITDNDVTGINSVGAINIRTYNDGDIYIQQKIKSTYGSISAIILNADYLRLRNNACDTSSSGGNIIFEYDGAIEVASNGRARLYSSSPSTSTLLSSKASNVYYRVDKNNIPITATYGVQALYRSDDTSIGTLSAMYGTTSLATNATTATYFVTPVTNATSYVWELPAGMTLSSQTGPTVTVNLSSSYVDGTISVKAISPCNETPIKSLYVKRLESNTFSITGEVILCANSNQVYTVPSVAGGNYVWTVSNNVIIISGQGTSSISVTASQGFTEGEIKVTCSTATSSQQALLNVSGAPFPTAMSGPFTLCGLTQATYSVKPINGVSFQWTVPSGMTITSGIDTNSISVSISGSVSGILSVRSVSSCGISAPLKISVSTSPVLKNISGAAVVCGSVQSAINTSGQITASNALNQYTYSVPTVSGVSSYTWSLPTGATLVSGQGTNSIVVSYDLVNFESGTISVQATNSCGTGLPNNFAVSTVKGKISGPTSLCSMTSATYTVPSDMGTNFVWTLPQGMSITSGSGTSSITVTITNPVNFAISNQVSVSFSTPCGGTRSLFLTVNCSDYTSIKSTQCGATVEFDTRIYPITIPGAEKYAFDIYDVDGTTLITTIESTTGYFSFSQINFTFGTTYIVKVRVKIGGIYGVTGSACNVTVSNAVKTTALQSGFCGTSIASLVTKIPANPVFGATGYRFEITSGGTTTVYDSPIYLFRLTDAGVATYGTTYSIRVAAQRNGVFGNYGASCNVTTPALAVNVIPTTAIMPSFCGTTLATLATKIPATPVPAATGYRFEITANGSTTVYNSTAYIFRLTDAGVAAYGTIYSIRVAALFNGVYGNYGASCNVTTPILSAETVPTTAILPSVCGTTLAALDTKIGAVIVAGATVYRFEITTEGVTTVYDSNVYNFRLSQTGVAVAYGITYAIRVAALVNGVYGNYGASCTVTTPGLFAPTRLKTKSFEVSAYPNPFDSAFNLNLETPSKEVVTIAVYDMMGKLVETHQVNPMEVANLQLGDNFAAGIYNVIVSQANEMQAIRLIRK